MCCVGRGVRVVVEPDERTSAVLYMDMYMCMYMLYMYDLSTCAAQKPKCESQP